MVLATAVKPVLFALAGAAPFAALSYLLVELFASWYGPRYIKSDDDIGDIYMISLVFMAVCLVAGAVLGFRISRR